jgi:hypothetical protein
MTDDPMHEQLLGHLLGALDDEEQAKLDARLEYDDQCALELARWRWRLAPLEAGRPDFEPPPGLAARTCRLIAAWADAARGLQLRPPVQKMSPCPVVLPSVSSLGWLDLVALALLLVSASALIFPAIDGSRLQTRVAACQNGLRQVALALDHYAHQQGNSLGELANSGRLTPAGLSAMDLFKDEYSADDRPSLCSDAWMAVQRSGVSDANGPDTWRDGTLEGGRLPPSPPKAPLLADAPSADGSGQGLLSHAGRGRNVLLKDGQIELVPYASSRDPATSLLLRGELDPRSLSVPVIFVSGKR